MKLLKLVAVLLVACAPPQALAAGVITQSSMQGQAAVMVSDGAVNGCGFRVLSFVHEPLANLETVDFSFNVYTEGVGLLKAGYTTFNAATKNRTITPIRSFWMKAEGSDPASRKGPTTPSQAPRGYLLQGTSFDDGLALIRAAFDGRRLMIGVRRSKTETDVASTYNPRTKTA